MTQQVEAPEKPRRRFTKAHIIALAVLAALSAVWCILLGDKRAILVSIILLCLWGLSKKGKTALKISATVIVLWIGFDVAPLGINSDSLWKYPIQRAYVGLYGYDEPDYFGDFKDDVKGEFKFNYMPTVMQGTAHYAVYFETDEDTLKRYDEKFSKQAKYSFTLNEYENELIYDGSIPDLDHNKKGNFNWIWLYLGHNVDEYRFDKSAQIYVIETNLAADHPHTSAVITDKENNTIFLTRLG